MCAGVGVQVPLGHQFQWDLPIQIGESIADGRIAPGASPAHQVAKPRRLPDTRRALTADELAQIEAAARTGGNDVILDALILWLHTETACRRGGALGLRLVDLDVHNGLVRLAEKAALACKPNVNWQLVALTVLSDTRRRPGKRSGSGPHCIQRCEDVRPGTFGTTTEGSSL